VKATIWHNPRCSKSRETLALLADQGLEPEVRLYLIDPPSEAEINAVLVQLGIEAKYLTRQGEALFRELNLAPEDNPDRLVAAMASHPVLIERPVVFANGKAVLGRPPKAVLSIL
jgi:arsenate reductase (glutaredoxin)